MAATKYLNNDQIYKLQQVAAGRDVWGRVVTYAEQQQALNALYKMERDEIADKQLEDKNNEEKRKALVQEDLEQQKIEVEKMKQMVEMFKVVVTSGAIGQDSVLEVFDRLVVTMLPGADPNLRQIAQRDALLITSTKKED